MKVKFILDTGKEVEIELSKEQERMIMEQAKFPSYGEEYYYIDVDGAVEGAVNLNDNMDIGAMEIGNCFSTEEEALNTVRALKLIKNIKEERQILNGDWDVRRKQETKWYIFFDYEGQALGCDWTYGYPIENTFGIYKNSYDALEVAGKYEDELKWYFTEFLMENN